MRETDSEGKQSSKMFECHVKTPPIVLFEHKDTTGVDGSLNLKGGLLV